MSTPVPQDVVKQVLHSYKKFKTELRSNSKKHHANVAQILKQAEERRAEQIKQTISAQPDSPPS